MHTYHHRDVLDSLRHDDERESSGEGDEVAEGGDAAVRVRWRQLEERHVEEQAGGEGAEGDEGAAEGSASGALPGAPGEARRLRDSDGDAAAGPREASAFGRG